MKFGSSGAVFSGTIIPMKQSTFREVAVKTNDEVIALLETKINGLSSEIARTRLAEAGTNEVLSDRISWYDVLLRQFKSAFIYLLLAASLIALFLGEYLDAAIVFSFLLINAGLGFYQEFRAENALALLKNFIERKCRVLRDGKETTISVKDVVPGDIVRLDAGDMIPADGYFLRTDMVTVDESPMTGEAIPIEKISGPIPAAPNDLYEAKNIGFSRTTLLSGDADLLVFATGSSTEVGTIAAKMKEAESPSAFEDGINHFSKFILKMVMFTVPVVFVLHTVVQGDGVTMGEFLLFTIALTVSVIPEALPLVTTISLSRGALHLAKKQVVPRRLSAIEDLGSINVLATDKTGTITENKLSVGEIYGERDMLLHYALMAPLSAPETTSVQNSVFDIALLAAASEGAKTALGGLTRIDELPFDPIRKRESVLVNFEEQSYLVLRGAPEVVCKKDDVEQLAWARAEGSKGRRVLAVAYKKLELGSKEKIEEHDEEGLTCIGLVSFSDPLKSTAKSAITQAKGLGVQVKIVTGDSKEVAGWVGYEAGLIEDRAEVLLGEEFERMSAEEQAVAVVKYHVFARTAPVQKFNIIKKLEEAHLVGFLGEGFNDAPALKMAHVGLAVSGASDIAQDASDIVLLNPSLEVIIDGIKEGRKIFANTMKYLRATLTSNFGNFYALAFSSLFIPYLPMLPIQVLLLNLMSDFPMISIASDNVDDAEIAQPKGYQVGELTAIAVVLGIVSTTFDFAFFGYFSRFGEPGVLQTMWFMGSILTELILLFSIRTSLPFWKAKRPSTLVIWLTLFVMTVTIAVPYIPWMQRVFGFVRPTPEHLGFALFLVLFYFVCTEIAKLMFYKYWNARKLTAKTLTKAKA